MMLEGHLVVASPELAVLWLAPQGSHGRRQRSLVATSSPWRRRWRRRANRQLPAPATVLVVPSEAARIIAHHAIVQLDDAAADRVEKGAVMGDGEDRPLPLVEEGQQRLFQPL